MKYARDFKVGERVEHQEYGKGTIYSYAITKYVDKIFVEFDVEPKGKDDKILKVSTEFLKKI